MGELLRERDELAARLTKQAFHDALTGLANRALFLRNLSRSRSATVFLIDLDDFKPVNDRFGTPPVTACWWRWAAARPRRMAEEEDVSRTGNSVWHDRILTWDRAAAE
ncbi:diguanylate cyclase domain-containing protein [Actinoplanes sp. CA-030573]|uniref:diguanylate cyclase domain-containing protein n=1 Tax=Actinoplanes sp. CA-030573 TaxID=3239898 RepID=UPI003D8B7A11